jgi:uncharacterized phage infection (PIP) family protein YhgE
MSHARAMSYPERHKTRSASVAAASHAHASRMGEQSSPGSVSTVLSPSQQTYSSSFLSNVKQYFAGVSVDEAVKENAKLRSQLEAKDKESEAELDEIRKCVDREFYKKQAEYDQLARGHEDLKQRYFSLIDQHQEVQMLSHEARKGAQNATEEWHRAQEQVARYKNMISASSQIGNQISDDDVSAKSDQIFYGVQDFVVKEFRGVPFGKIFHNGSGLTCPLTI